MRTTRKTIPLFPALTPIPPTARCLCRQRPKRFPGGQGLQLSYLLFLPSLSVGYILVPETQIRRTNRKWRKTRAEGRTAGDNEPEERESNSLSLSDAPLIPYYSRIWEKKDGRGAKYVVKQREEEAEQNRMKEEKRRKQEAAAKRPC